MSGLSQTKSDHGPLLPGDRVEVRSAAEIMATLDHNGCLDKLPFMPEMLQYCGKQFHVFRRADKTCDTVNKTGGRRMRNTVHLANLRCDGAAHGDCQAACLLFWKEAWLRPATDPVAPQDTDTEADTSRIEAFCSQDGSDPEDPAYRCQATTLPEFTTLLHWWDIRQYWRDLRTGNTTFWRLVRIFILAIFPQAGGSRRRHARAGPELRLVPAAERTAVVTRLSAAMRPTCRRPISTSNRANMCA